MSRRTCPVAKGSTRLEPLCNVLILFSLVHTQESRVAALLTRDICRIVRGWRTSHKVGTRGVRRETQRKAHQSLTGEQRDQLQFAKEQYRIGLELDFLGILDCPVLLSTDISISVTSRYT